MRGVLTSDEKGMAMHLAIYLDRYCMMQQLTPASSASSAAAGVPINPGQGKRITITIDG